MSKTFKALQRAARERAAKKSGEPELESAGSGAADRGKIAPEAGGLKALAPDRQETENWPLTRPESHSARRPEANPGHATHIAILPTHSESAPTQSEDDLVLQELLKEALVGGMGMVRVEKDGWVRGAVDPDAARRLLGKYALLHCLRQDATNYLWFWSSTRAAQDRARRSGLPLDLEGLPSS